MGEGVGAAADNEALRAFDDREPELPAVAARAGVKPTAGRRSP